MSAEAQSTKTTGPDGAPRPWARAGILILFALLYGYDLFEAISDTVGVTSQIAAFNENALSVGLNPVAVPWVVLILSLALPPAMFALALFLGRRQGLFRSALVFVAGLSVVAALTLSLASFAGLLAG